MRTYNLTLVDDRVSESRSLQLNDADMEWVLNSLRAMQDRQMELAQNHQEEELDLGGKEVKKLKLSDELFVPQYEDITKLREKIVLLCGYDLTDG